MHIPTMTSKLARALFDGGLVDPMALAIARPSAVADVLMATTPFKSSEVDAAQRYR